MAHRRIDAPLEHSADIRLLAAPTRQDIVETIEALGGRASVSELAAHLGRPSDGLYYHLRVLVRGGLVVQEEADGCRHYRVVKHGSRRLRLRYKLGENGNIEAVEAAASSMLRTATRDFNRAIANTDSVVEGAGRDLWTARCKGWVGEDDLAEVNGLLNRLLEVLQRPRDDTRSKLVTLTWALAPIKVQPLRRDAPSTSAPTQNMKTGRPRSGNRGDGI